MTESPKEFTVKPIGYVQRAEDGFFLKMDETIIPAMKELENFSHVQVLWWAHEQRAETKDELQCTPPYGENPPVTGVFATRAEYRPNPIGLTIAKILAVDHEKGLIQVQNIDAFDKTPILDLKAYFPVCDRVKDATIPDWLVGWPEWFPDEGLGI